MISQFFIVWGMKKISVKSSCSRSIKMNDDYVITIAPQFSSRGRCYFDSSGGTVEPVIIMARDFVNDQGLCVSEELRKLQIAIELIESRMSIIEQRVSIAADMEELVCDGVIMLP